MKDAEDVRERKRIMFLQSSRDKMPPYESVYFYSEGDGRNWIRTADRYYAFCSYCQPFYASRVFQSLQAARAARYRHQATKKHQDAVKRFEET